jgi:hypothetical protein
VPKELWPRVDVDAFQGWKSYRGMVKRFKVRQLRVFIVNRFVSGKGRFSGREASFYRRHSENSNLGARNKNISLDLLGLTIPG